MWEALSLSSPRWSHHFAAIERKNASETDPDPNPSPEQIQTYFNSTNPEQVQTYFNLTNPSPNRRKIASEKVRQNSEKMGARHQQIAEAAGLVPPTIAQDDTETENETALRLANLRDTLRHGVQGSLADALRHLRNETTEHYTPRAGAPGSPPQADPYSDSYSDPDPEMPCQGVAEGSRKESRLSFLAVLAGSLPKKATL